MKVITTIKMDLTTIKPCIVNVSVDGWYKAGADRLERSLIYNGFAGDMIFWKNEYPPNSPSHFDNPYAFKITAFREAFRRGYKIVMWLDSSFWAIKNPMPIFDIINDKGIFAFRSGYNCAQTCTDKLLEVAGITRDEAEKLPEIASGIVGINIDNPDGKKVFNTWAEYCDLGLFKNNRLHDISDSADQRFLHGRQDQSALSLAIHKNNVEFLYEDYVTYYDINNPLKNTDKAYFFIGGI
jgi:hypothetical protein